MIRTLIISLVLLSVISTIEARPKQSDSFLIDPLKPYVYLKFDHIGERQPLPGEERSPGLWLRLVNNCQLPIIVATFDYGEGNSEIGVYHDVIQVMPRPPLPDLPKSSTAGPTDEAPRGYHVSELLSTTTVAPGTNLLFSVPQKHVSPSWYTQIRFYFELPNARYGFGPYSVLSFVWQDIPKKVRQPNSIPHKPATR